MSGVNKDNKMLTVAELLNIKIIDLDDGREKLKHVQYRIHETVRQMQRTENHDTWNRLSDQKYELVKTKRSIQAAMGKIVKERRNV